VARELFLNRRGAENIKYKFVLVKNGQSSASTSNFNRSRVFHILLSFNQNKDLGAKPPSHRRKGGLGAELPTLGDFGDLLPK